MNQVFTSLPDNRPVTAIIVVENPDKCPKGFQIVAKTHDQDSDADLWKESGFFGKKVSRYLCLSKTEGSADRIVEAVMVISDKQTPPDGFNVPSQTYDTGQKAWRKKRLCYKMGHSSTSLSAVTDVIVLSRAKKPPEEFFLCGEINGMTLCHKIGKVSQAPLVIPYSVRPGVAVSPVSMPGPDYINAPILSPQQVIRRPAPPPPVSSSSTYATISGFGGLEGVPFIINPKFAFTEASHSRRVSIQQTKTTNQIDHEYCYDFRTERAT